jgi:WD40 repeat protein
LLAQVGTPVEMLILDATVLETRLSKMVAFGGDSKRVVVYQYDIKPEAEKPPERHKTLAEGAAAAARAPLAPLMAVLPGESLTLGRKGGQESSPGKPDDDASRRRKKSLQTNMLPATLLQWAQAADPAKAEIESDDGPLEATIVRMRRPPVKDAETKDAGEDKKQASSPTIANRMLARAKAAQEKVQAKSRALFKRADSEIGKTAEGVLLEAKIIFRREYTHVLNSVSLSGNTHRLAVGDARGGVHVHDFSTDSEVFSWDDASQVFAVSLSYSGQHLATGGAAKSTHVFDVDSGAEIYNRASRDRLRAVALSSSGQVCLLGGFDGTVNACNIHAGVRIQSFEQHDVVRSVATDAAGVLLAVGCDHGRCALYDLSLGTDISTPPRWAAQHDAQVWVVDVSRNGAWVVAGDYNNIVRVYNATDGTALWQKDTWQGKNSQPFTWGLSFSGDSSALAIGHWDSYAYVIDTATWTELVALKRSDRVYSVSMDDEGQRVAVGGRDKTAAVYALQRTASGTLEANSPPMSPNKSPIVQLGRRSLSGGMSDINESDSENGVIVSIVATINVGAFIYSVSLSGDGRRLAVGTVDNMVGLYSVATQEILHSIRHQGSIQSVKFSPDANYLAVGGEEHAVTVWRLSEDSTVAPRQFLVLPRQSPVHSVAFSDVGLAFASGSLATVYGGLRDYDWTDRPSFEVVADVMEHPNALQTLIEQHPTVLHMKSPLGGESLLQHTVRKRPAQKVEMLLGTGCRFGLIEDVRGHTALMIALKNERKPVVRMLLNTIAASTQDQPAALKQFMRHRVEIAGKYPDLFIEFLQNIDLVEEEDMMPQGHNIAYLKNGTDLTTAGSSEKKPLRFWEDLMEVPLVVDAKSMGPNLASKRSHTVLSSDPTRKTSPRIDGELLRLPEGYKKVEVAAVRVPLVDAVSQTADHIAQPQTTLLFLIAHAAQELDDHHIFSTLIVRSMLQYKWHSYAQFVFHTQFYSFVGLLASTCLSAYSLPRLCMPSFCDDAHKICALCYDDADVLNYYEEGSFNVTRGSSCDRFPRNHLGFAIDPDLTPDRSWSLLWRTSFGQIFLLSFLVALSGSFLGISLEFRQVSCGALMFNASPTNPMLPWFGLLTFRLLFVRAAHRGRA